MAVNYYSLLVMSIDTYLRLNKLASFWLAHTHFFGVEEPSIFSVNIYLESWMFYFFLWDGWMQETFSLSTTSRSRARTQWNSASCPISQLLHPQQVSIHISFMHVSALRTNLYSVEFLVTRCLLLPFIL
jgi:hypothetical protein